MMTLKLTFNPWRAVDWIDGGWLSEMRSPSRPCARDAAEQEAAPRRPAPTSEVLRPATWPATSLTGPYWPGATG